MEKLNELETLAKKCASMRLDVDVNVSYANFITQIEPEHIIDIADEFRAQKQRAEAAEAKIKDQDELIHSLQETVYRYSGPAPAETEKYSPVIKWLHPGYPVAVMELSGSGKYFTRPAPAERGKPEPLAWIHEDELPENYPYDAMFPYSKVDIVRMFPVFGPAPAVNLADLVPGEITKSLASIANEYQTTPQNAIFIVVGWNACRTAILRNIEEAKK